MFTIMAAIALSAGTANPAPADDPTICKRAAPTVGTRLNAKRTCLRKSDWDLIEKQTQRELQSQSDRHLSPGKRGEDRGGGF